MFRNELDNVLLRGLAQSAELEARALALLDQAKKANGVEQNKLILEATISHAQSNKRGRTISSVASLSGINLIQLMENLKFSKS